MTTAPSAPHRLGRRQLDVLRAAANGTCRIKHGHQGRCFVYGASDAHPDTVADTLLDYEMIELVDDDRVVNGCRVEITDAGRAWLAEHGEETAA